MIYGPELLLIGAVGAVGVLHTILPDHWAPITLISRQWSWSHAETASAAFKAGTGHVVSTLVIALIVSGAGIALAARLGYWVDIASSIALVGFGGWITISALSEMRGGHEHSHGHGYNHARGTVGGIHGAKLQRLAIDSHGELSLSIYEDGVPAALPADRQSPQ